MAIATHRPDLSASTWDSAAGHPRRKAILLVLCLSLLVVVIDNTVLNTALPTLARELHTGTSGLQWIVDAYSLCFASLLVPAGAIGDRFGRRRALVGGLVTFAVGSAAAAFAPSAAVLIADRVVMGLGAAFVMPSTLSILNAVFPPGERAQAIAAWSAVAGVGIVIGPTLGGALLSHFAWGSVFLVNVPLVALALVGVIRIVPETAEPQPGRLDLVGTVLAAAGLVALVDAIIEGPDRGWTSPTTLIEVGLALGILATFVRWELRAAHPLIDLRVFASRAFSAASASVTVIFFSLFGSLFALTQYLQLVHGYSPLSAGVRALPFALAMGLTSPLSAAVASRLGTRVVVAGGLTMLGAGLLALSTIGVASPYPPIAAFVAVMGGGMGLVMAPASATIMASVPPEQAGAGSAVNDTIREVGGALGIAVIGSLVSGLYGHHVGQVLTAHHAPATVVHAASGSVAAADVIGHSVGGSVGGQLLDVAHSAFTSAMGSGMRVAAAVALAGAIACFFTLPGRRSGGLASLSLPAEESTAPAGNAAPCAA
jgi:EmrB/QacA subfamily drug resistance transporter